MNETWPRGSEWRKWDLHLHAPSTKLNDQYRVKTGDALDEYCRILAESDVAVFGITDYFSADGYFSVESRFTELYPESNKAFFCNIELRLSETVNRRHEEVHIHIIFNPSIPNHKLKIRSFLQALKTNKTGPRGLDLRASILSTRNDFASATTTRPYIRYALEDTFGRDADLLDFVLIITAANNDGIRPQRGRMRKELITDEIDKFSDAFFGNSRNVEYFLNTSRGEDPAEYFARKPVLSDCDAHSFPDLTEMLGQVASRSNGSVFEPTWIKADPTYEGLKQITFEPMNRVYIGKTPEIEQRVRNNKTKYIDKLHLSCIDGYQGQHGKWFTEEEIVIGKELVAIIGNKGSGKSALTDILGLLGNSHHQSPEHKSDELFSFLNRRKFLKRGCAANFIGKLTWHDGSSDQSTLEQPLAINSPEKVEYLPQKYLERICTTIGIDQFAQTLNEVVFRYVELGQRYGQRRLEDLIAYRTHQVEEEIRDIKRDLDVVNKDIVAVEGKLVKDHREKIEAELHQKQLELAAHKSSRPPEVLKPEDESTTNEEAVEIERITKKIHNCDELIESLTLEQQQVNKITEELRQFKQSVERESAALIVLEDQYRAVLESSGIAFKDVVELQLDLSQVDRTITENKSRLSKIRTLLSDEDLTSVGLPDRESPSEPVNLEASESIVWQKAVLERNKMQLVERQAQPMREYQTFLSDLQNWTSQEYVLLGDDTEPDEDSVRGLEQELRAIRDKYRKQRRKLKSRRVQCGVRLLQKKRDVMVIYDRIKQSIDAEIESCRGDLGDYMISIESALEFDDSFFDRFLDSINQSRKGSFYGIQDGRMVLQGLCESVDDWEDESEVFRALDDIVEALHVDKRRGLRRPQDTDRDVFKQMKNQSHPVVDLYNYVYGLDYLTPKYNLRVDQKDLSELSPGERGGLLLVFYLMLDRRTIPLIIDQPDDNLDNKSVYEMLVTFIKHAKNRRQIILVTHNPNLAVVADSEQIIHVSIDKEDAKNEFRSFSGSIEAPKINRAVVDILEGTLPAFDNRRLKYRRHP